MLLAMDLLELSYVQNLKPACSPIGNAIGRCRAEVLFQLLASLAVQLLVLELSHVLLACLLVMLAVGLLTVYAAVLDKAAYQAVLELGDTSSVPSAVAQASWPPSSLSTPFIEDRGEYYKSGVPRVCVT